MPLLQPLSVPALPRSPSRFALLKASLLPSKRCKQSRASKPMNEQVTQAVWTCGPVWAWRDGGARVELREIRVQMVQISPPSETPVEHAVRGTGTLLLVNKQRIPACFLGCMRSLLVRRVHLDPFQIQITHFCYLHSDFLWCIHGLISLCLLPVASMFYLFTYRNS